MLNRFSSNWPRCQRRCVKALNPWRNRAIRVLCYLTALALSYRDFCLLELSLGYYCIRQDNLRTVLVGDWNNDAKPCILRSIRLVVLVFEPS